MRVTGRSGVHFLVAVLFPVTMVIVATALLGGGVVAEDDGSPTPPPQGDWNVTMDTVLDGVELNVSGNITVLRYTTLTIVNTTLNVRSTYPHQHELLVRAGASLHVTNSTLVLDTFVAETQSALVFEGDCLVRTRGRFLGQANSFFAEDTTFLNMAHQPTEGNRSGEDAIFIANGKVNSEFVRVTIENIASNATDPDPDCDGLPGGASVFISNVTTWNNCTIICKAGSSSGGGLVLTGQGGTGARGGDVTIRMTTMYLENLAIYGVASAGGYGVNGASNPVGDAGDGGDGSDGGNATVTIEGTSGLVVKSCTITVNSGDGGSGGNGGSASDGDGGIGGYGADAGAARLTVACADTITIMGSTIKVHGGSGGYGGDYGRLIDGKGKWGSPAPAGNGGLAHLEVTSEVDIIMEGTDLLARGGLANDGGYGYDQGETGGDGSGAVIWVEAKEYLDAEAIDLKAVGGFGGNGGAAYSGIYGNGGDGGDATIVFSGRAGMDVRDFSIYAIKGQGGRGNNPIYDGVDGIHDIDIITVGLRMEDGKMNGALDDLLEGARADLCNVTIEDGLWWYTSPGTEIYENYPVIIHVVDERGRPRVGWTVDVYSAKTGALVATAKTDEQGRCEFMLPSFRYFEDEVEYLGSYIVIVTSPDGGTVKKVRYEVQSRVEGTITVRDLPPIVHIRFVQPEQVGEYLMRPGRDTYLETWGTFTYDAEDLEAVSVQLYRTGHGTSPQWAPTPLQRRYELVRWPWSEGPGDDGEAWGKFYRHSGEDDLWGFALRYDVFGGDITFTNGTYGLSVNVTTAYGSTYKAVEFNLVLDPNAGPPLVVVQTPLDGRTFYGKPQTIRGQALDDWQLTSVEVRVDGGPWIAVNGTEAWTYVLETGKLADGEHEVTFRAFDGEHHSQPLSYTFWVDKPEDIDGGGGDDGGGDDGPIVAVVLALVGAIVAVLVLLAALSIRKRHEGHAG